jgi:hypothetical protein
LLLPGCLALRTPSERAFPRAAFRDDDGAQALAALAERAAEDGRSATVGNASRVQTDVSTSVQAVFRDRDGRTLVGLPLAARRWARDLATEPPLALAGSFLVVADGNGTLTVLDTMTGNIRGRRAIGPRELVGAGADGKHLAVVLHDRGRAHLGALCTLLVLNRNDEPELEIESTSPLGGPAVYAEHVFVPTEFGVAILSIASARTVAMLPYPVDVAPSSSRDAPVGIASVYGSTVLVTAPEFLLRIDPQTLQTASRRVPRRSALGLATFVAEGGTALTCTASGAVVATNVDGSLELARSGIDASSCVIAAPPTFRMPTLPPSLQRR